MADVMSKAQYKKFRGKKLKPGQVDKAYAAYLQKRGVAAPAPTTPAAKKATAAAKKATTKAVKDVQKAEKDLKKAKEKLLKAVVRFKWNPDGKKPFPYLRPCLRQCVRRSTNEALDKQKLNLKGLHLNYSLKGYTTKEGRVGLRTSLKRRKLSKKPRSKGQKKYIEFVKKFWEEQMRKPKSKRMTLEAGSKAIKAKWASNSSYR